MNLSVFFAGVLVGAFAAGFAFALTLWEKFIDHGGAITFNKNGKSKIFINEEDICDLEDQRYVILKVIKNGLTINQLPDVDPMSLERNGGTHES